MGFSKFAKKKFPKFNVRKNRINIVRFQLKVECYNDTLVGGGPTSLKGLVEGATGLDPRAMRFSERSKHDGGEGGWLEVGIG